MKNSLLLGLSALMPLMAWSYDPFEISNAAGMYLTAADIQKKLSISQCGYILKKPPPNIEHRLQEVLDYLTPSDRIEIESFVRSNEFKNKMKRNQLIIDDIYGAFIKEGYDNKTACGLLWGSLSPMISKGDMAWKAAIKSR